MEIMFDAITVRAFYKPNSEQGYNMKNSIIIVSALALLAIGTGCSSEKMAQINKKHIPSTYVQNPMPTEEGLAPVAEGPDEGQPSTASAAWGDNFLVGY